MKKTLKRILVCKQDIHCHYCKEKLYIKIAGDKEESNMEEQ